MIRSVVLAAADATLVQRLAIALPPDTSLKPVEIASATHLPSRDDLPADTGLVLVQAKHWQKLEPWIRQFLDSEIPVVAILSNPNDRDHVFRVGVRDYMLEPLIIPEVQARLVTYLQHAKTDQKGMAEASSQPAMLEQLDRQLAQNERWIAMGRVVAAICHDITNRMQAAQGALTLAAEEPLLSGDMQEYLDLGIQETRRVTTYMQSLRRVYHPEIDTLETINVHALLSDVRDLTSDTTVRDSVRVETFAASDLPPLWCKAGQLQFMLVGVLLNLTDLIAPDSPADVRIAASQHGSAMRFEVSTDSPLADWARAHKDVRMLEHALGLSTFRKVAAAQGGNLGFSSSDSGLNVWISLPILSTTA